MTVKMVELNQTPALSCVPHVYAAAGPVATSPGGAQTHCGRPAHDIKKRHQKASLGRPSRAGAFSPLRSPRPTGAREPLLACPERPSKPSMRSGSEFQGAPFGTLEVPDSALRALATRPPCIRNGRGVEGSERSEVEWQGMSELWRACVVKMSSIGWSSPRGLGRSRLTSGARRRTMVFETHATCATATMEDAAPERGRAVCGSWIERLCPPRAAQCRPCREE